MRTSRPLTVTLGDQQSSVDARVTRGDYASASEVLRAAVRALDREERAIDEIIRAKIAAALADPRPAVPLDAVFAHLERKRAQPRTE